MKWNEGWVGVTLRGHKAHLSWRVAGEHGDDHPLEHQRAGAIVSRKSCGAPPLVIRSVETQGLRARVQYISTARSQSLHVSSTTVNPPPLNSFNDSTPNALPHQIGISSDEAVRLKGILVPVLQVVGVISRLNDIPKHEVRSAVTGVVRCLLVSRAGNIHLGDP